MKHYDLVANERFNEFTADQNRDSHCDKTTRSLRLGARARSAGMAHWVTFPRAVVGPSLPAVI